MDAHAQEAAQRHGAPLASTEEDRRRRQECPVARTPDGRWYVASADAVQAVLKDVDTFRADLAPMSGLRHISEVPPEQYFLSEISPPRHGRVRRLYNAWFGPQRVGAIEPFVRALCHRLVDDMLAKDEADLHGDYAMQIPARVMARAMDLDEAAAGEFMRWSYDGSILLRPCSPGVGPHGLEIQEFFARELAARRAEPDRADDLFRLLDETEIEGRRLTDREIVTQLHFMIQAGVHTTRGLLAHLGQTLLFDPDLFARLQGERDLVPRVVEESLRHDSPAPVLTRRCTHDADLAGVRLAEDDLLSVSLTSANRDESRYDDPDAFRLDRPDPKEHFGFGAGPHVCPGAALARMEGVTAVEVLLERLASIVPVAGATYPPVPSGLSHLPIPARLTAAG